MAAAAAARGALPAAARLRGALPVGMVAAAPAAERGRERASAGAAGPAALLAAALAAAALGGAGARVAHAEQQQQPQQPQQRAADEPVAGRERLVVKDKPTASKRGAASWTAGSGTGAATPSKPKLPEEELKKRYKLGEVLGEGTFAVVRVAIDRKSKDKVAIKEINKSLSELEALENEIHIMERSGKHENLVSLRDVFDSKDVLYLVMDLAEGGELFDRIIERGELSEKVASRMFLSAVKGVHHLHERNIAHLDIKPENLLLTSKSDDAGIKIADFGLAIDLTAFRDGAAAAAAAAAAASAAAAPSGAAPAAAPVGSSSSSSSSSRVLKECVGTPAYWSPEMVRNETFDERADVWALGCVLYILLTGAHPFDPTGDATEAQILAKVAKGKYDTSSPQYLAISLAAKDLIRHMLDPNPSTRYTTKQLLRHPWLAESGKQNAEPLRADHITKLRGFRVIRLLRQGMQHLLGPAATDLFTVFDADGDGFISREELRKALAAIGQNPSKGELDQMIKTIDNNSDGLISREEFDIVLRAPPSSPYSSMRMKRTSVEDIEFLFRVFDRDKDGYIEHEDFLHVLALLGAHVSGSRVRKQIARVDQDNDGRVDFAEFVAYWRLMESERVSGSFDSVSPVYVKHRRTANRHAAQQAQQAAAVAQ